MMTSAIEQSKLSMIDNPIVLPVPVLHNYQALREANSE
jgi:hypothetical protein